MLTGQCLCGQVRFEIDGEPGQSRYCHCTRCQRRTGTAVSAQVRIDAEQLRVVAGAKLIAAYEPPEGFAKLFCSACGSALFGRSPAGDVMSVRLGVLDPGHGIRPAARQFVTYAAEWEPIPDDGLPRHPELPPRPAA